MTLLESRRALGAWAGPGNGRQLGVGWVAACTAAAEFPWLGFSVGPGGATFRA